MVDFCCCHSSQVVVFLEEASFCTQTLKMRLLVYEFGVLGAWRQESVCLLLNMA